jgi:hypothetical protein
LCPDSLGFSASDGFFLSHFPGRVSQLAGNIPRQSNIPQGNVIEEKRRYVIHEKDVSKQFAKPFQGTLILRCEIEFHLNR